MNLSPEQTGTSSEDGVTPALVEEPDAPLTRNGGMTSGEVRAMLDDLLCESGASPQWGCTRGFMGRPHRKRSRRNGTGKAPRNVLWFGHPNEKVDDFFRRFDLNEF